MGKARDPLSTFYDDFSGRFLATCRADLYGWHTATVRSPAHDTIDARGLSRHERAVVRSLYYTLNSTDAVGPQGGRWIKNTLLSLQILGWSEPEYGGGVLARLFRTGPRRRVMTARLVGGYSAARFVDPRNAYTLNPAEQAQWLDL